MTIHNMGSTADHLIAVEAAYPKVMMHSTDMHGDVAVMVHLDQVTLKPGAEVQFEPGGLHVMFMGLNGDPLEPGETVPATLIFENAGRLDVMFTVEARDHDPAKNHDAHMGH